MGQRPAVLTPHASGRDFLGAELRRWREYRGMSAAELARLLYTSGDLVCKVEKAKRTATAELVAACDVALDTGGALGRLLAFVEHLEDVQAVEPLSGASIVVTVNAEVLPSLPAHSRQRMDNGGGAHIYAFPGDRRHTGDGA